MPFDPEVARAGKRNTGDSAGSQGQSCQPVTRFPFGLPADTPVFTVPAGLVRILDRDLKLAGIPKRDGRGRVIDVHALRVSFGTLLSKGGVAPRTAQAAMRHSTIDLTMNTDTDPKLLDVAGAMEAVPELPLAGRTPQEASATGTEDATPQKCGMPLAPMLAPPTVNRGSTQLNADKGARWTNPIVRTP